MAKAIPAFSAKECKEEKMSKLTKEEIDVTAKKIAEKINQYGRNKIKECGGALLDKLTEELPGKASEWSVMVDDNNDISVYSYLIPITLYDTYKAL